MDVTGITVSELSAHNISYRFLNDSVITIDDADQDTNESGYTDSSDTESDCVERNSQYVVILVIDYSSQLSLNGHFFKTDTFITQTAGVSPCSPFFSHFTVSKLPVSRTPLYDGQLVSVPMVSVLERVDVFIMWGLFCSDVFRIMQ